ncbi:MAG: hypothetical protein PHX21_14115 [bacterium]|nr:hypothetical protein [bacterium]
MRKNILFSVLISLFLLNIKPMILLGEEAENNRVPSSENCEKLGKDEMQLKLRGKGGLSLDLKVKMDKEFKRGMELLNENKYEDSVPLFENFLLTNPQIFDHLFAIGAGSFSFFSLKAGTAAQYFENKVKTNANDYFSAYYVGLFEVLGLKADSKGSEYLKKALQSKLNFDKAHYLLGLSYLLQGNQDLYLSECNFLKKRDIRLSEKLKMAYSNSQAIQVYLKDIIKDDIK